MVRGHCLCGGVQFQAASVERIVLCHCSLCRRANGSAFDASAMVPASDFAFLAGEDLLQAYESSPGVRRAFCRVCGSRLPFPTVDGTHYWVPAGTLDDGLRAPAIHIFVGSKAPWWEITDDLPQFEQLPPELELEPAP